jgi:hypothetical protein
MTLSNVVYQNKENLIWKNAYQTLRLKTLERDGNKPPRVVIEVYANKPRKINDNLFLISHRISEPSKLRMVIRDLIKMLHWLENTIENERRNSL